MAKITAEASVKIEIPDEFMNLLKNANAIIGLLNLTDLNSPLIQAIVKWGEIRSLQLGKFSKKETMK